MKSYKAFPHVVQLFKVAVEQLAEVALRRSLLLNVGLHCIDVRLARSDVVSDCAHLLYFISQQAVESNACLEEADVA